jgi:hypothetical protein
MLLFSWYHAWKSGKEGKDRTFFFLRRHETEYIWLEIGRGSRTGIMVVFTFRENRMIFFTAESTRTITRTNQNGTDFLIAPVIALVPGVLNGELALAEEVSKYLDSWNGIPVPLGHPQDGSGSYVSANTPDIVSESPGRFWNATWEDGKLKGEIWIDVGKVEEIGGEALETYQRIERGDPVEVSTAYFRDQENTPGTWDGEQYSIIQRNLRPDHLALLPDEIGACSWEDGCGVPRVNEDEGVTSMPDEIQTNEVEESLSSRVQRVRDSFHERFNRNENVSTIWPDDIYEEVVIASSDEGLNAYRYSEDEEGVITFEEPIRVEIVYQEVDSGEPVIGVNADQRMARFTVNSIQTEDENMLIENENIEDAEELEELEEGSEEETPESTPSEGDGDSEESTPDPEPVGNQGLQAVTAMVDRLGGVEAVEAAITQIQNTNATEQERLVESLVGNSRNTFTREELESLPVAHLRKLDESWQVHDYSGFGAALSPNVAEPNGNPMPSMWDQD